VTLHHSDTRAPEPGESGPGRSGTLTRVADALFVANERRHEALGGRLLPSRNAVASLVEDVRVALYPNYFGSSDRGVEGLRQRITARLLRAQRALIEQARRGLTFSCKHVQTAASSCSACDRRSTQVSEAFFGRLPALRQVLDTDIEAAFKGDPAAKFADETLFCYPGVTAIIQHRLAHELHALGVPLIPRIVSELAHGATGIDIHPAARIGASFFIDHGTGVVIGETCTIGERVRIYQGVTLGARGFPGDDEGNPLKGLPRHPMVEDDVIIYAGATILGRITIGKGAVIGGNVWLTRSVPAGANVTQARARQERFENGAGI
jgi:serine O-acetyltransferase